MLLNDYWSRSRHRVGIKSQCRGGVVVPYVVVHRKDEVGWRWLVVVDVVSSGWMKKIVMMMTMLMMMILGDIFPQSIDRDDDYDDDDDGTVVSFSETVCECHYRQWSYGVDDDVVGRFVVVQENDTCHDHHRVYYYY